MMRDYFTFRKLYIFPSFSFCGSSDSIPVIGFPFTEFRDLIQIRHMR